MPLAPVDNNGTSLFYQDFGAPDESETYTTVVIIHGTYFNGRVFESLIPYARAYKLRIVTVNQRDYRGSTPYSPDELSEILTPDKEVQSRCVKNRVLELATFLEWFITNGHVPPIRVEDGRQYGGLGVVAWSLGNSLSLSFLAYADAISLPCRTLLQEYLRTIVVYDAPTRTTGAVYPQGVLPYSPFVDITLTPKEAMEVFPRWNSGYYTHSPDIFASFSATSLESLPSRAQVLSGLVMTYDLDEQPEPTITRIPADFVEDATDTESAVRSRQPDPRILLEVFRECRRKALYDAEWARRYFPKVKVEIVTFTKTPADCVYAAWDILHDLLEVRAQKGPQEGERKVSFHVLEGVNHHAHWDYPERVLDLFSKII